MIHKMKRGLPARLPVTAALFAAIVSGQPLAYTISSAAGGSTAFEFSEGAAATSFVIRSFSQPAVDRQGAFYFSQGNRVIRVGPDGTAKTYAGTGQAGFSGEGGPATSAMLNAPGAVLFDPQGRLLIFDTFGVGSNRIRRVELNGAITTIAGTGDQAPGPNDGDGGLATSARIHATLGTYDSGGNLFFLDSGDFGLNMRRIDVNGRISTVAHSVGVFPIGMASDGTNIYLADLNPAVNRVARLTGSTFTPIAGPRAGFSGDGGPSIAASVSAPNGIAIDSAGNLHLVDTGNARVRTIRNSPTATVASGQGVIATSAGTGTIGFGGEGVPALASPLSNPSAMTVDPSDNLYISDGGSGRFRKFRLGGMLQTVAGLPRTAPMGDSGPANQAALIAPGSLFRYSGGNFLVVDGARIRQITPDGLIATIAGLGVQGSSGDNGPAAQALFQAPQGVVEDSVGNVYVLDGGALRKFAVGGTISTVLGLAGAKLDEGPAAQVNIGSGQSLAIDAQDNIYVGSFQTVRKLTPAGTVTRVAGTATFGQSPLASGDARSANLTSVYGLAVDPTGNLFVADTFNHRILKVTPAGQFTTLAGAFGKAGYSGDGGPAAQAMLNRPAGMAFDAWGNFYISDQANNRVRKVTPDGAISTIAGSATAGFAGDGGPALGAQLSLPFAQSAVADPAGNILLVDNNRIRKLGAQKLLASGVLHAATKTAGPVVAGLQVILQGTELIPPGAGRLRDSSAI